METIQSEQIKARVAKHRAARQANGLRQVTVWVREEDAETLRLFVKQPHALSAIRESLRAEVTDELRAELKENLKPKITQQVRQKLTRSIQRAIKLQERSKYKRIENVIKNTPPSFIRFHKKPPVEVRELLKKGGWIYNPVAQVWITPKNESEWEEVEKLLIILAKYEVEYVEFNEN